jgi:hypothetical protein
MWYALSSISWLYGVSYVYLSIDLAAMLMYAQIAWNIGRRFEDINAEVEVKLLGFKHNMTAAHRGHRMPLRVRKFARNTIFVSTVISTPGPADSHDMSKSAEALIRYYCYTGGKTISRFVFMETNTNV